jgi:tRNA pseudouridine13 synthase
MWLGMTIRKLPNDFRVDELADPAWLGLLRADMGPGACHAVYRVVKQSLATPELCVRLARALGVPPVRVEHAGLKDKHARTRQYLTVAMDGDARANTGTRDGIVPELGGDNWSAELVGFAAEPVRSTIIAGNAFEIVVRDLSPRACEAMIERAELLRDPAMPASPAVVFTNYFGDQRFGSARHGEGFAARRLVEGDFEGALRLLIATPARKDSGARRETTRVLAGSWGRWDEALEATPSRAVERHAIAILASGGSFVEAFEALPHATQTLCVEAYQSYLWNAAARALSREVGGELAFSAEDDFGEMAFVPVSRLTDELRSVTMPMPARGVEIAGAWGRAMRGALDAEGLEMERLTIPGVRRPAFRSAIRPLLVAARGVEFGPVERDELASPRSPNRSKQRVSFTLPRGAYATVLLRALGQ